MRLICLFFVLLGSVVCTRKGNHVCTESSTNGVLKFPRCDSKSECEGGDSCIMDDDGYTCCVGCVQNEDCMDYLNSKCVENKCTGCQDAIDCLHLVRTPVCFEGKCQPCSAEPGTFLKCPWLDNHEYQCGMVETAESQQYYTCQAPNNAQCWRISKSGEYDFAPCISGTSETSRLIDYKLDEVYAGMAHSWCRYDYDTFERDITAPLITKCFTGECKEDRHCADKRWRKRCNLHILACVECVLDSDCTGNPDFLRGGILGVRRFCDLDDYRCKECRDDLDCTNSEESACENNVCKVCETSADCRHIAGKPNCASLQPEEIPDVNGCVAPYGAGQRCFSRYDMCEEGKVCLPEHDGPDAKMFCKDCSDDSECKYVFTTTPLCVEKTGSCSECDPTRPGALGACIAYKSTTFFVDGIAKGCSEFGVCERCAAQTDCNDNYVCNTANGECQKCMIDSDCLPHSKGGYGLVCDNGECVECLKDEDCEGRHTLSRCNLRLKECIPCLANQDCRFQGQKPQCAPTGCIPCLTADDCATRENQAACKVHDVGAPVQTLGSWAHNRCTQCVPETEMTVVLAHRKGWQYIRGYITAYNEGCDRGQVCFPRASNSTSDGGDKFICRDCKKDGVPCKDPALSRCNPDSLLCEPCAVDDDCAGIHTQRRTLVGDTYYASPTGAQICRLDPINGNRCVECNENKDCGDLMACINNLCYECQHDGSVSCGDGYECVTVAVEIAGPPKAVLATNQCKGSALKPCSSDEQCVYGAVCDFTYNPDKLEREKRCLWKLNQACDENAEMSQCAEGLMCIQGKCKECIFTSDCATSERKFGTCDSTFMCKPCNEKLSCADASGITYVCDEGVCGVCNKYNLEACEHGPFNRCFYGACAECSEDAHCEDEFKDRFCRVTGPRQKECVECTPEGDPRCGSNEMCVNFRCVPVGVKQLCRTKDDCTHRMFPHCLNDKSMCAECSEDKHCRQKAIDMNDGFDQLLYPKKYACSSEGTCEECSDSSHCEIFDSSLGSTYEVCRDYRCKACDGSGNDETLKCPKFAPVCVQGTCRECVQIEDCPLYQACIHGHCIDCTTNEDCGQGYLCSLERCVQCTDVDDTQCINYDEKPKCFENQCVECFMTHHCADKKNRACIDNQCVECSYDTDCNQVFGDDYVCHKGEDFNKCIGTNTDVEYQKEQLAEGGPKSNDQIEAFCPVGYFKCKGGLKSSEPEEQQTGCIAEKHVCDGIAHCNDKDDETDIACKILGKEKSSAATVSANAVFLLITSWILNN